MRWEIHPVSGFGVCRVGVDGQGLFFSSNPERSGMDPVDILNYSSHMLKRRTEKTLQGHPQGQIEKMEYQCQLTKDYHPQSPQMKE